MLIRIGSLNPVKIAALRELLPEYPFLAGAVVAAVDVPSHVSAQPKSLDETVRGAVNRAREAFWAGPACDHLGHALGVGIESGLMVVPYSRTGYLDVCACVVYVERMAVPEHALGLSSAFECPAEVVRLMVEEGLDMNQAFGRAGLTRKKQLGSEEGAIGVLTRGRVDRKEYTKQAIRMALIHLERP